VISRRAFLGTLPAAALAATPTPYGALPSPRQLHWHELETNAFLHFTVNTFTDKEWGYGDEDPSVFKPTAFDADAIVDALAAAGMRGVILTCKHHDGFCLWPTKTTDHSVRNSSWRNGQADVVRDISQASRRHGLEFGVYLSPWDRNNAAYGTPAYIQIYRRQLTELLTNYGEIFEVWHDGANGGDGYYGGARQKRNIDRNTYYDWPGTWELTRSLQPKACIFSDVGPTFGGWATSAALQATPAGQLTTPWAPTADRRLRATCASGNRPRGRVMARTGCRRNATFRFGRAGSGTKQRTAALRRPRN